jgi:hypothetical protein
MCEVLVGCFLVGALEVELINCDEDCHQDFGKPCCQIINQRVFINQLVYHFSPLRSDVLMLMAVCIERLRPWLSVVERE